MNWSSFRPGGGGVPVSSSGWASSRIPRSSGTPLGYCSHSGILLLELSWLGNSLGTACVGVISSYLRVLIGPKVMTISLSVVDWLRTR